MLQHGLILLERALDLEQSNGNEILLVQDGPCHGIRHDTPCYDMVYLLVKHLDGPSDSRQQQSGHIAIHEEKRVYGCQTANFRNGEQSRRKHIMRNSDVKVCLGHGLSSYQMDCLEVTLIGFLLLMYGRKATNNTIYPRYIYNTIPADLSIDRLEFHPDPIQSGRNTWGMVQRAIVIGTAPPQTLLSDATYQRSLEDWRSRVERFGGQTWNPLLDWERSSGKSRNIQDLMNLLASGGDELPTFVDHYPGKLSGSHCELLQNLEMSEIMAADTSVRQTITSLNKDVIIMLGARPTLLYPRQQTRHYLAAVCPFIDLHWITRTSCGFVFWWPHLGARRYTSIECSQLLEQIWLLLSHKLNLLLWMLNEVAPNTIGLIEDQAVDMLQWLSDHPTSIQLEGLLKDLTEMWPTNAYSQEKRIAKSKEGYGFDVIRNYNMTPISALPEDPSGTLLPIKIRDDLPCLKLSQVMNGWSANRQTVLVNKAVRMIPNFHALEETEQAHKMQLVVRMEMDNLMKSWLGGYIRKGLFVPFPGESERQQWGRFWKQINMQRMLRGRHPDSVHFTCCWCGQQAKRVKQEKDRVNFSTIQEGCPNNMAHTLGWEAVPGSYDIFPASNLFLMFYESLPSAIVLNHWQMAAAFSEYLTDNRWHVQAQELYDRYHGVFPRVRNFQSAQEITGKVSAYIKGISNAMKKLKEIQPPCNIIWGTRRSLAEERAWSDGFRDDKTLFGIRLVLENASANTLSILEDLSYADYGPRLGIIRERNSYVITNVQYHV
jgi:hypothetical protein